MNKVILIGNISTDIELKATPNGNYVATFNIAVNDRDNTTFIPVEVWKRQAENISKYCSKGSKIAVEGAIKINQYEKDGQRRTFTNVVAFNVEYLNTKNSNNQQGTNTPPTPQNNQNNGNLNAQDPFGNNGQQIDVNDTGDFPF